MFRLLRCPAELIRPSAALCLAFSLGILALACGRDSQAPTAPGVINPPAGSPAGSLEIVSAPTSLLVNESVLFTLKARNADGTEAQLPPNLQWTSSDATVARVQPGSGSSDQVVTALRRGTVTITVSAGSVAKSVSLSVKARVSINPASAPPCEFPLTVCVAIGETPVFYAFFVDVNGLIIGDSNISATWASSAPDVASVSSSVVGRVTGLRAGRVTITASHSDGVGAIDVIVTDVIAGVPARVRFAHADQSRGPLTFVPSRGAPVTLTFGESVDVPIVSGTFSVQVAGFGPIDWSGSWLVRDGDHLEIFATGWGITGWWSTRASIPADSGLVRFVQGARPNFALVMFLGAPGATEAESRLINCYFDPKDITQYLPLQAGEFDVLAGGKDLGPGSAISSARERITVAPGRAITYVITGDSPETMRVLAFRDF